MVANVEIDEAGRIVIPSELHDALHLIPGERLVLREEDGAIILRPRGLYWKNGIPVYETGPLPADHVDWVKQSREDRAEELMGEWNNG